MEEKVAIKLKACFKQAKTEAERVHIIRTLMIVFWKIYEKIYLPSNVIVFREERRFTQYVYLQRKAHFQKNGITMEITPAQFDVINFLTSEDNNIDITPVYIDEEEGHLEDSFDDDYIE